MHKHFFIADDRKLGRILFPFLQVVCADLENERKAIKSITVYLCLTVHPEKQNPKPFGLCTAKCLNPGEQAWAGSLDRALFLFSHYWPL